jgi:hypothetical protein
MALMHAVALPTKPLNAIALSDADPASALSYVKQQLQGVEAADTLDASETAHIERLGGRTRDLESVRPFLFPAPMRESG